MAVYPHLSFMLKYFVIMTDSTLAGNNNTGVAIVAAVDRYSACEIFDKSEEKEDEVIFVAYEIHSTEEGVLFHFPPESDDY